MQPHFARPDAETIPLHAIGSDACSEWLSHASPKIRTWAENNAFAARLGQLLVVPGESGAIDCALFGLGTAGERKRKRFALAAAAPLLPKGSYHLATELPADLSIEVESFGWLMAQYSFGRYKSQRPVEAMLVAPAGTNALAVETQAAAETLTRDLINTPAEDMGPAELEAQATQLAETFGATISCLRGEALLEQNFPLIHTVGRASDRAPRLIDMRWGSSGPKLTLVGKGVCFDTGGLNLKPGASMGLMKKDMGGAANVLGLAHMIMSEGLGVQLRVLIPAVENAVSGPAFRPGDILTSRKGLTVEINNTDAEGRLVLADALALAAEDAPDLLISMATLTGAARVAVGADLAPFYTDHDADASALTAAASAQSDPVWRMPFHAPYEALIEPGIADLDNAPSGGFAGSITAALFLRRFAGDTRYMHFDIYGWNKSDQPARKKGGVGQGIRALNAALPEMLGLS